MCSIVTVAYLLSFRPAVFSAAEAEAVADEVRRSLAPENKAKKQVKQP